MTYRYFIAFYYTKPTGENGFGNATWEHDKPIRGPEDITTVEKFLQTDSRIKSATVTNFIRYS